MRTFYRRRALRLFPPYYLTLLLLAISGYKPISDYLGWHLTFTSNVSIAFFGGSYWHTTHLWAVCAIVQFYLVWSCIVLLSPRSMLANIIIGIISSSVAYRLLTSWLGLSFAAIHWTLFGCLDSLCAGSLLALFKHTPEEYHCPQTSFLRIGLFLGMPTLLSLQILRAAFGSPIYGRYSLWSTIYSTLFPFAASLTFAYLINAVAFNSPRRVTGLLGWPPVRYVGKISYGIYLYNPLIGAGFPLLLKPFGLDIFCIGYFKMGICAFLTVVVATISWYMIENPASEFMKRFT